MKKAFFALVAVFAITFSLHAQFSVGARGGVTLANVHRTEFLETVTPDFSAITGAAASALAELELGPNFALQAELGYIRKGFALDLGTDIDLFGISLPIGAKAESRFNYLELPLLAKAKFGNERAKFYALAGPALSYAAGGRLVTRSTGLIKLDLINTSIDLDALGFERFDFSAVGGAGVEFNTGFGKIFLDARYTHGFLEIYDIPVLRERANNRGFTFGAGVMVGL